jgi:hypothetical protein
LISSCRRCRLRLIISSSSVLYGLQRWITRYDGSPYLGRSGAAFACPGLCASWRTALDVVSTCVSPVDIGMLRRWRAVSARPCRKGVATVVGVGTSRPPRKSPSPQRERASLHQPMRYLTLTLRAQ